MHEFPIVEDLALLDAYDDPAHMGQLTIEKFPDGWGVSAVVRPGLSEDDRASFEQWAQVALTQLLDTEDPERNGWFVSQTVPDRWYMTCAARQLPEI